MAIEITGRTNSPTPIKTPPKAGVDGEKKVAIANTVKDDSIALTSATQEIKKTLGSSSTSPVNIDRVNAVKKALADGNYPVNAERAAKKLIQFEKLMPQDDST
ncbi:MAG: flagellar biosynthesis anti-sigma factor FlgM [Methylobacter sp.]|jgi:negative regulator of flagellin synthesis FlgM|nr:flagellar biosynthesis anti-sigma factor FlgM [Methylobacter sp.]